MTGAATIELYVGSAIEHASERDVLAALVEHLTSTDGWSAIFANIHVGGRQIDFLVATDSLTLIVEAKHFSRRIRGQKNGQWQMHGSGGVWRSVGNPYRQALEAKNALRDQLCASHGEMPGYPDACVVFAPALPTGSDVPASDFKVSIISAGAFAEVTGKRSGLLLSRQQWVAFAQELGLQRVQTPDAACDARLLEQEALLAAYRSQFLRTYAPDVGSLKSDRYEFGAEELDAIGVADRVAQNDEDLLILGPSGCGKTLLAKKIGIHCLERGHVPMFLQGKYFAGTLGESMGREAGLLGAPSAARLILAAKANGRPLVLILDGYNECPAAEQLVLTRSLAAAARRYGTRLIVSAQVDIVRPDLIDASRVVVSEPDKALKLAIAESTAGQAGHRLAYLLDWVSSGLEADLVGRVGATLADGASRFALFDAYARQKLGDHASDGIRFLAAVAGQLIDRMSFSLSIRDFDRLAAAERIHGDVLGRIVAAGLVVRRSDRVSFRHELIFSAFAAESVVRQSDHDVKKVLLALVAPKYRNSRALILGAYDDDRFVANVLARIEDAGLLRAALDGECGVVAYNWVVARCDQMLEKLTAEAAAVRYSLWDGTWAGAGVCEDTLCDWSPSERALMTTISNCVWRGTYLDRVLHAVGEMDRSLSRAFDELREEAREKKVRLRTALFADAYVMSGRAGISQLVNRICNGNFPSRAGKSEVADNIKGAWERPRTPGQTYLLLTLVRFAEGRAYIIPHIVPLLGEQWRYQPYHLQLALLNSVHFLRLSDDGSKQQLVDALEALLPTLEPMVSGMVVEALEHMGALEKEVDQHVGAVREDLQNLLSGPMDAAQDKNAWAAYSCQFDHPFSSAYCEVIQELNQHQRKRLLTMACRGAGYAGLFVSPLIQELTEYQDPKVAPALERWTALPELNSFMPQESISVFVWAHVALGMLGTPPPADRGDVESPAKDALIALGDLHYWAHRSDLDADRLAQSCSAAMEVLLHPTQLGAASALYLVTKSMSYENAARESVIQKFPGKMLCICRNALQRPDDQIGYFGPFGYDRLDVLRFSIDVLGNLGVAGDLPFLRSLSDDQALGESAIKAIQLIEGRVDNVGS
ncbi:NERD domain-containing protein [Xanthomonas arboricola]|uniref:NERD domain-containing protein n=1 Tax=Xanthomonas arboricola TaxID=56448 RepID=UPI001617F1E4|nr:NERD domain-containing protein [Xanthomonas arboricola]MBB3759558.1 hypothetical protein [Xanthomonas arboricola]